MPVGSSCCRAKALVPLRTVVAGEEARRSVAALVPARGYACPLRPAEDDHFHIGSLTNGILPFVNPFASCPRQTVFVM